MAHIIQVRKVGPAEKVKRAKFTSRQIEGVPKIRKELFEIEMYSLRIR